MLQENDIRLHFLSLLFRRQLNYRTFLEFRILELLRIHYHFQPAKAKYKSGSSNNSLKIWGTL